MPQTQTRLAKLQDEANAHLAKARTIAQTAIDAGREMTDSERADFDAEFGKAKDLAPSITALKNDASILDQARKLAAEIGPAAVADIDAQKLVVPGRPAGKSLGLQVVGSDQFQALIKSFPGGRIPDRVAIQSGQIPIAGGLPHGGKALIVGGSDTSAGAFVVPEQTGIVELLGRRPLTVRDLISVRRTGSDTVEYVRQTAHTNAAAPVAEATTAAGGTANTGTGVISLPAGSGVKPEGAWTFERETATVKTIAEWVPVTRRALADVAQLEGLINDELAADIAETEETQIISGNGTGENLEGILTVSGTQAQAWDTDLFTTIRKGLTKVRVTGRSVPTAIGLNPADVETIDLAQDNEGRYYSGGPFNGGPRTLWGVPYLDIESVPAGTGVIGDWRKAVLWDREQTQVTVSTSHADFFTRNLVAVLGEERVAFGVIRPSAFVIADLTA